MAVSVDGEKGFEGHLEKGSTGFGDYLEAGKRETEEP